MQLQKDRRALHQIPELDRNLPETVRYLENALARLNCRVFRAGETGLCAFFDFGREESIAFRADMDALPVTEKTGAEYASRQGGIMHACGHDGHMAIALELARRLDQKTAMPNNVLLIFQSAEETTGGAREICESGVFEQYRVKAVFGLHLWPGLEAGVMASRKNELMARSCEVNVDIYGKSAHIAKADQGADALAAAVEFYSRTVKMEGALDKKYFRLLKFGKMESGTVRNALSAHSRLEGSLRAFQDDIFEGLRQGMMDIAQDVAEQSGCEAVFHFSDGYPAVMNPGDLYEKVRSLIPFRELEAPSMTAEDFAWYQRYVPGMFFFLGTGDTAALHADTFDFDEGILEKGVEFFEELGEKFQ